VAVVRVWTSYILILTSLPPTSLPPYILHPTSGTRLDAQHHPPRSAPGAGKAGGLRRGSANARSHPATAAAAAAAAAAASRAGGGIHGRNSLNGIPLRQHAHTAANGTTPHATPPRGGALGGGGCGLPPRSAPGMRPPLSARDTDHNHSSTSAASHLRTPRGREPPYHGQQSAAAPHTEPRATSPLRYLVGGRLHAAFASPAAR